VGTVAAQTWETTLDLSVSAHSYRGQRAIRNGGKPLRVLLAIAHPVEAIGARVTLERGGFEVCAEADSAQDAIETVGREHPDVCLIDVALDGGGIRSVKEICRRQPEVAVVVYTESEQASDFFDALRAGARGYLLMDADPQRLPIALRAVVNGEAALPRHLVPLLIGEYRRLGRYGPSLTRESAELTNREREVMDLMSQGLSTSEIAKQLFVEPVTVRTHVSAILRKLHVSSRNEALQLLER
jgi:DNA-binding NarL/FixJ family response regulator